ncbi:MAG: hypothetical protein JW806_04305 [Sedimentisphaerales bacterium]|nr:hypothetical protein [Sedimentisphaerales bacterium]
MAWGENDDGQCDVPDPNTDFIAISAGNTHSLGLKADGSIMAWGYNLSGCCDVPEPNANFTSVATGASHSLGLKADGSIMAWGYNVNGECNVPEPNTAFIAISASVNYSLGLKNDGSIIAWGKNDYGECNVPGLNTDFIAISTGHDHSLGLKVDGSVAAWGRNNYGQCNVPDPNAGFIAISAGYYHSLGLKADGSVVAWGNNSQGQCDVPEPNTGFVAISGGGAHSLGWKSDGSVVAWGWNYYGQCDAPEPNTSFSAISAGNNYSLGLKGCRFTLAGDLSDDCRVNFDDHVIIADSWISDFTDIIDMVDNWLINCEDVLPGIHLKPVCAGHWTMNDDEDDRTVIDSSYADNNGTTIRDTDLMATTGHINGALHFDGTGDYITIDNTIGTGSYTKAAWIKLETSVSAYSHNIISGAGGHAFWAPNYYTNKLSAGHSIPFSEVQDPNALVNDTWYFVAVTYDSGTNILTLYKDGEVVDSNSTTVPGAPSGLNIGKYDNNSTLFAGDMDNVMLFRKALSQDEILALYNGGSGTEILTNPFDPACVPD